MLEKILEIINLNLSNEEKLNLLYDYHDSDLADILATLDVKERLKLYEILSLDQERLSEIISYTEEPELYLEELGLEKTVKLIEELDSDDADEILEEMDEEDRQKILDLVDEDVKEDLELIASYDDDLVGSLISNNYITVYKNYTVPDAMNTLVKEAEYNDNFNIIFVLDENDKYYGLIELKDLFIARRNTPLEDIIEVNYPKFLDTDKISDIYPQLTDYDLPIYPVVNEQGNLLGVIDHAEIVALIEEEMKEDIAKFAAIPDDLDGGFFKNAVKRLPWLITLLVLGVLISLVISRFEGVVKALPIIIFFQSLVLSMGGNIGTQSLAITIRVLND